MLSIKERKNDVKIKKKRKKRCNKNVTVHSADIKKEKKGDKLTTLNQLEEEKVKRVQCHGIEGKEDTVRI